MSTWKRYPHTVVQAAVVDTYRAWNRPGSGSEKALLAEASKYIATHPGELAMVNIATNWGIQGYSHGVLEHLWETPKAGSWTAFVHPRGVYPTGAPTAYVPADTIVHPRKSVAHGSFAPIEAFAAVNAHFGNQWWRKMVATPEPRVLRIRAEAGFGNRVRAMASHVIAAYLLGRVAVVEGMPHVSKFFERPQGPGLQWARTDAACQTKYSDSLYQSAGPPEQGGPGGQPAPKWGGLFQMSTHTTLQWQSARYRDAVEDLPYLCFQTGGAFCVKFMLNHTATPPSPFERKMLARQKEIFGTQPPLLMNQYRAALSWILARPGAELHRAVTDFKVASKWDSYKLRVTTHVRTCIGDSCGNERKWTPARIRKFITCAIQWIKHYMVERELKASDVLLFIATDAPHTVLPIFNEPNALAVDGGDSIAHASISNVATKRRDQGGSGDLPIVLDWFLLGEGDVFFVNVQSSFTQTAFARSTAVTSAVIFGGPPHKMTCDSPHLTPDMVAQAMEPPSEWGKRFC
jgi:hypothetical protein